MKARILVGFFLFNLLFITMATAQEQSSFFLYDYLFNTNDDQERKSYFVIGTIDNASEITDNDTNSEAEQATAHKLKQPPIDIRFYPNPVRGSQFTVKTNEANIASIEMVSVIGELVLTQQNKSKSKEMTVALRNIQHGLYLVKVHFDDKQTVIKKLLVE